MSTRSSRRCGFDWRRCRSCSWSSMERQLGDHQHSARPVTSLHHFCHGKKECVRYGRDNRKILQIHGAPEAVELLLGVRGTQGLKRGICGRRGFVRRLAVAPFDGVLKCMMDAKPGHSFWMRLGPPFRRRPRQVPSRRQPWGERCALGVRHSRGRDVHGILPVVRATAHAQSRGSSGQ
ncbi:hypothetical protein Tc00.1047053509543.10 [Trypanosoma cruzi]|uniref:Uncharacterized protein n=1 Tax=Trypanosoma cruzi (strain CL Brener) TaxID=353153 RepID=Q4CWK9_TRYCC|nr:hypothetical protein Tc00.1047053509543.10 [Trypanosoma cruzi]EAN84657.1 hypothetical protein Tc00.1047053509543.10 [Trypanosoma cruzi]|eukprot:XP_806508.1 hypothetical protein [Trypanosoma cruzi strain CL Brener]